MIKTLGTLCNFTYLGFKATNANYIKEGFKGIVITVKGIS